MVELRELSYRYDSDQQEPPTLRNITLSIAGGECILLSGPSGCGKTTLTRVLNGLCPRFYGGTLHGSYVLAGKDTKTLELSELGRLTGSVFQDPRSQFFCVKTDEELVFGLENNGVPHDQITARLERIVKDLSLDRLLGRSLFDLSSGEKQMIAIASVIIAEPKIVIMDEPSANLDEQATEHLSSLLRQLKSMGHTIIVSEHRLHYLKDLFDRMILMDEGTVAAEYSRAAALALSDTDLSTLGLRAFNRPALEQSGRYQPAPDPAVDAENITIAHRSNTLVRNVSLALHKGEVTAIMGKNGAGKTTFCRALTGVVRQSAGTFLFEGSILGRKQRLRDSFLVQQDNDYQLYAHTVLDEFSIGSGVSNNSKAIEEALRRLGLEALSSRHPLSLSSGQKQRLLLALASVCSRRVLVFDEPTSGLDARNMEICAAMLRELADAGRCVVLVTHDRELVRRVADSVVYMSDGEAAYRRRIARGEASPSGDS